MKVIIVNKRKKYFDYDIYFKTLITISFLKSEFQQKAFHV